MLRERAENRGWVPFAAGIFIADDFIIISISDISGNKHDIAYSDISAPQRISASGNLGRDVKSSFDLLLRSLPKKAFIASVGMAIPGPILGSGTVSVAGSDILTSHVHRKGSKWREVNLKSEIRNVINSLSVPDTISYDVPFSVIPDAAAYALGEYYCELNEIISVAPDRERTFHHFRSDRVLAHLTLDEGIAGAVVSKGDLLKSKFHSEIGHLPVRYYKDDKIVSPKCHAHKFLGCAEAYIALPALRARWGRNTENEMLKWRQNDARIQLIAYYIAQICINIILTTAPSHISVSGRIVRNLELVDAVDLFVRDLLTVPGTYKVYPGYIDQTAPNFVRRRRQKDSGVYGCLLHAARIAGGIVRGM